VRPRQLASAIVEPTSEGPIGTSERAPDAAQLDPDSVPPLGELPRCPLALHDSTAKQPKIAKP
jgi:hypothetical protein